MEIKLKAKYKNNVRAKHLLRLMQRQEIEAVKVFLFNLAAAGPVDLVPIPKDVDDDIYESMAEAIRLKSQLFEQTRKTGKRITIGDLFAGANKWQIPRTRLISPEAFAKGLGAEEIKGPKVIARLGHIRQAAIGLVGGGDDLGREDLSTSQYYDIAAARNQLGELVSSVAASGKAVTLTKQGKHAPVQVQRGKCRW